MHSAKLVSNDGEKFVHPVAQIKAVRPANVRAIFFVQTAKKTSEHTIRRNHQFLPPVNNAFDRQRRFFSEGFNLRQIQFGRKRHAFDAEAFQKVNRDVVEDVQGKICADVGKFLCKVE